MNNFYLVAFKMILRVYMVKLNNVTIYFANFFLLLFNVTTRKFKSSSEAHTCELYKLKQKWLSLLLLKWE